ncbi:c2H2-type domain-containing protein [Nephila pilipes]|uniref:C2H2-type domain-containing protein n=1 Tax=Nephila pilipes TaxID=299642 RepID=A0A8X6PGV5_NEPPI|nr:c2H2-type domain-containing protein [Nephila pilipes]
MESVSSFTVRNTYEKEAGLKFTYYICHRNGVANPTLYRIRHAKASGFVKSDFACPGILTVSRRTIDAVTEINVQNQPVQEGHDIEVEKLHLTNDERSAPTSSFQLGNPKAKTLDKTREEYSLTKRFGLTKRKDL